MKQNLDTEECANCKGSGRNRVDTVYGKEIDNNCIMCLGRGFIFGFKSKKTKPKNTRAEIIEIARQAYINDRSSNTLDDVLAKEDSEKMGWIVDALIGHGFITKHKLNEAEMFSNRSDEYFKYHAEKWFRNQKDYNQTFSSDLDKPKKAETESVSKENLHTEPKFHGLYDEEFKHNTTRNIEPKDGWIKVSDGLPTINKQILLYDGCDVFEGYFDGRNWWKFGASYLSDDLPESGITHWQHLPKKPIE